MSLPIRILSTDFDGTLHADAETPPVPKQLEQIIAELQAAGVIWVINTGRDLPSLMDSVERAQLSIRPDFVVSVEREIHCREKAKFVALEDWNCACRTAHETVFQQLRSDMVHLADWVRERFRATIYEDTFSPFCLIADSNEDADCIQAFMDEYCRSVPNLSYVRNTVYARFSHVDYNKGSALAEIGRRLGVAAEEIAAAGDHLNDLPMLCSRYARWLIAPSNAIAPVKEAVLRQNGYVSELANGNGVAWGLEKICGTLLSRSPR